MPLLVQPPEPTRATKLREQGLWRRTTLFDDLLRTATDHPTRPAIVSWREKRAATETLTYEQLAGLVSRVAAGLRALGVAPGDVVSLQLPNWWEFTVLHLACVRAGAVTHPMSPILGRREVITQVRAAASRLLILASRDRGGSGAAHNFENSDMPPMLLAGDTLEQALFDRPPEGDLGDPLPDADAAYELQFTSGTTGHPKGVVHTHNSAHAGVISVAKALGLTSEDTVVMAATFGHQTGFLFGCCLPVILGATAVIQDTWDPVTLLELADRFGATWTSMAPAMVMDSCAAARARGGPPTTLRYVRTSGGPTPWSLAAETRRQLGAQLLPSWGMTETGVCTMRQREEPDGLGPTDGTPMPGVELRYERQAIGSARELAVRSPGMFAGYLARGAVRSAPDWFRTGDLAISDGRGGIRIAGRTKDLIIRGGENIPVAEIEMLLAEHPSVQEVAVVAVPDLRLGERACAVVVPTPGDDPELPALNGLLAQAGMTKQFWPERLVLAQSLPRTTTGKLARAEIRTFASRSLAIATAGPAPSSRESACAMR